MKFGNENYCQVCERSVRLIENTIWEGILCGLFHGTRTNIVLYREVIRRLYFPENILIVRIKKLIESITQKFSLQSWRESGPQNQLWQYSYHIRSCKKTPQ